MFRVVIAIILLSVLGCQPVQDPVIQDLISEEATVPDNGRRVLVIVSTAEPIAEPIAEPTAPDNSVTNTFRWTPTLDQVGEHEITFTATDTAGATVSKTVTIIVEPPLPRKGLKEFGLFARDWLQPDPVDTPVNIPTEEGIYDITYSLTSRYTIPANTDPNVLVIQVYPDPNSITNITKVE